MSNQDLSPLHHVLAVLETSRSHSDRIIDGMHDFFVVTDSNGRVLKGNNQAAISLDTDIEGLLNKNLSVLFQPDHWQSFKEQLRGLASGSDNSVEFEIPILTQSAAHPDFLWSVSRFQHPRDDQGWKLFVVSGRDISAFKRTFAELQNMETQMVLERETSHRQAEILNNIPDIAWLKNKAGVFIAVNEPYARACGRSAAEIIGKTDLAVWPPEIARRWQADDLEVLTSDHDPRQRRTEEHLDWAWLEIIRIAIRDEHGAVVGMTGIARNITDRKRAETELATLQKKLLASARQAGMAEVATEVLHNVGNVINSVNVSATMIGDALQGMREGGWKKAVNLLRKHRDDLGVLSRDATGARLIEFLDELVAHQEDTISKIKDESESIAKHLDRVNHIISLQQTHAKNILLLEPIQTREIIEDALTLSGKLMTQHPCSIIREYADLPLVEIDRSKLLQVLKNVINNAVESMIEHDSSEKRLVVRTFREPKTQCIQILDNGIGIAKENLTRIFNHGFTTRENSQGFGLHAAANAVKEMGGSILAESAGPGKGASFTIKIRDLG